MDLFSAINDRTLLQAIAADLAKDVEMLSQIQPTMLFGDKHAPKVDSSQILQVLQYLQSPQAPMWQLQYMFYIVAYWANR